MGVLIVLVVLVVLVVLDQLLMLFEWLRARNSLIEADFLESVRERKILMVSDGVP